MWSADYTTASIKVLEYESRPVDSKVYAGVITY